MENTTLQNKITEAVDDTNMAFLEITKINNYLYLGSYDHALTQSDDFKKLNIDVIINCASKEVIYNDNMHKLYKIINLPLEDDCYASLLESLDIANEMIHKYLQLKKKIYIHCINGISRSPAILIFYLMSHKKYTFDNALKLLKKKRPMIDINPNFECE